MQTFSECYNQHKPCEVLLHNKGDAAYPCNHFSDTKKQG